MERIFHILYYVLFMLLLLILLTSPCDLFQATLFEKSAASYQELEQTPSIPHLLSLYYCKKYQEVVDSIPNPALEQECLIAGLSYLHLEKEDKALELLKKTGKPGLEFSAALAAKDYTLAEALAQILDHPLWKARVSIAQKNLDQAEETLLSLDEKSSEKSFLLGIIALEKGDFSNAKKAFKSHPLHLGKTYLKEGKDFKKAEEALLKARPSDGKFKALISLYLLQQRYDSILSLKTDEVSKKAQFEGYLLAYQKTDNAVFEEKFFQKAKSIIPDSPSLWDQRGEKELAKGHFKEALACFEKIESSPQLAEKKADCLALIATRQAWEQAYLLLEPYDTETLSSKACLALFHLWSLDPSFEKKAEEKILRHFERYGTQKELLAALYQKSGQSNKAKELFKEGTEAVDYYHLASLEGDKELFLKAYKKDPNASFADECYFRAYSFKEYVLGDEQALNHLEAMLLKYPSSPYLVSARYLLALQAKKERRSNLGKRIHKSNLSLSIEHLEKAEELFLTLDKQKQQVFEPIAKQAKLELALIHFKIATESLGPKKLIYFQEAEKHLNSLLESDPSNKEALYWLAMASFEQDHFDLAKSQINSLLAHTNPGFEFQVFFLLGKIAYKQNNLQSAKENIAFAESYLKNALCDEKLELYLLKAEILQMEGLLDEAMLTLSLAINDNSISSLRVLAMIKRADLYQKQGRFELCRKQLEACAKLGGPYGDLAKQKLEKIL